MKELTFRTIGIERLRVVNDGDGITTLVAGVGCPLRCRYCLNPQCFECSAPSGVYTVKELIDLASIDDLYFQATGGGVVFGGGEPLLQADFIHAFRTQCPAEWKLYLESSLAVPEKEFAKVIDDIDFFLIDIKDMDPDIYRRYTGADPDLLQNNLRLLAEKKLFDKTLLRIPLIPGYNSLENQEKSIAKLRALGFSKFDLFTYRAEYALKKRSSGLSAGTSK